MSERRYYPLNLSVQRPYRISLEGREVAAVPSANDVPVGIEVIRGDSAILVRLRYPDGDHESPSPRSVANEFLRFDVGTYSGRLLSFEIVLERVPSDPKEFERASLLLVQRLRTELDRLRTVEKRVGPRVNYDLAERGLALTEAEAPPAWLIDAMRAPHPGRPAH